MSQTRCTFTIWRYIRHSARKGLAKQLMEDLLQDARQKKAVRAFLAVRESNVAALAFYATLGFREEGRRKKYYNKPTEDAICMALELGK